MTSAPRQITAVALVSDPAGFWPAKIRALRLHDRVKRAWRRGRGVAMYEPRVDPPAPDAVAAWRARQPADT